MMKISKSKFVKSAISILLVVMMLLSAGMSSIIAVTVDMVSESANVELAETGADRTIYYNNTNNWSTVTAHHWGGTTSGTNWPGPAMTKVQGSVYSVTIPDDRTHIIFSNNGSNKTGDLELPKDGKNYYDNGTWSTYGSTTPTTPTTPDPGTDSSVTLRGTFNNWSSTKYMKYTADPSVVSYTLDLAKDTTYEFKIHDGSSWRGNKGTFTDTCSGLVFSTSVGDNCKIKATGGTYTFAYDTSTNELTVTKEDAQTFTVTLTENGGTGTIVGNTQVNSGQTATFKVTAPDGYYVSAVSGITITPGKEVTFTTGAITSDTEITITYTANPTVTVNQNGGTGTIKVNNAVYTSPVTVNYNSTASVEITAPEGYYVSAISGSVVSGNITLGKEVTFTTDAITENTTIEVTYAEITKRKVTIAAYDSTKGTLRFGGNDVPADGEEYEVYDGDVFTVSAVGSGNYTVSKWVVNGSNVAASSSYSVQSVDKDYTIAVEWKEASSYTVKIDANPYEGGTATGAVTLATSGSSSNITSADGGILETRIKEGGTVTLTAASKSGYKFSRWQISGTYNIVKGDLNSATGFEITPTGDVTIVAVFDKSARRIYLKNEANWGTPYAYVFGGSSTDSYPGVQMTWDDTLKLWYRDVPSNFIGVKFNQGGDAGVQYDGVLSTHNLFTNVSDKTGYPTTYVPEGIYLQGTWNNNNYSAYDLVKFNEERGGIYTLTIDVTATDAEGYIYVNPTDKDSKYYNAPSADAVSGNSVTLDTTPGDKTNAVKIFLDMEASSTGYSVTFTFIKERGVFSWVATPRRATITVNGTNGSISGAGNTYFETGNTVVSTTPFGSYAEAKVVLDEYFTIYTQINTVTDSVTGNPYEYYVMGYVINGNNFVSATALGNGKYSADIRLSAADDGADIVPIYFHTKEYLTYYGIDTTTFYVVIPEGIKNWTDENNYIGAYTWYYKPGTDKIIYEPFGKYPGQLLIPIAGLDNVYYTLVETTAPTKDDNGNKIYVDGVTLTNYYNTSPSNENNVNVQTYDYYEFVSYTLLKRKNITYVLKDHNDKNYNNEDVKEEPVNLSTFDFIPFTNYNKQITDVFGTVMTQAKFDEQVAAGKVLHAVRVGNRNYLNVKNCGMTHPKDQKCPLNGKWYVDIYFYDNAGKFIAKCHSYQLSNGEMADALENYRGYAVNVSYETVTTDGGTRWDGEWYADTNNTVTVDVSVNVALSDNNGKTWIHAKDLNGNYVNTAIYGTALVNDEQSVKVTRGSKVSLVAQAVSGYRFIGWATADGKIFSKNVSETVDVAISTSYTAVYQKLASGVFYLNHYLYKGDGTAPDYEIPDAHNGRGDLYVQIEKLDKYGNVIANTGFIKANSADLEAKEGDILRITIATDPAGIDRFYAWYVGAEGPSGTTYEEVGVDSFDNMAMPKYESDGVFNPTYENKGTTVVGSSDMVYYQFMYEVGTEFNLTLYSDIVRQTANKTLIYTYNDRGMGIKKYYVNIELTTAEIEAGYTPSPETISKHAPFVGDYYKDIQWVISKFDKESCELWGTNITKYYTVTAVINGKPKVENVPYNTQFTIDASDYGFSKGGFWYQETNEDHVGYTEGEDPIIANGTWYSYVVTKNMTIGYEEDKNIDFNVSLDAPVYGREQSTDSSGNNKVDKVLVDYVVNMVTPFVYGDGSGFEYSFGGAGTDKNMSGNMVTIESLINKGYKVTFGILLEQVGSFAVKEPYGDTSKNGPYDTYADAEAAAKDKGFGKATKSETLSGYIKDGDFGMLDGKYYINYEQDMKVLSNKNRYRFLLELPNTASYRKAFYNVYAYMTVKAPGENSVAKTYISNVQTLNIYPTVLTNATPVIGT